MAGRWLRRRRGQIDLGQARAEATELLGRGQAEEALELVRAALAQAAGDPELTLLALRALSAHLGPAEPPPAAWAEAAGWLAALAPTAEAARPPADRAELAFWRGWLSKLAGDAAAAEDHWHTAWLLDPAREDVRAGLIIIWSAAGACPDWGLELLEAVIAEE